MPANGFKCWDNLFVHCLKMCLFNFTCRRYLLIGLIELKDQQLGRRG